MNTKLLRRIQRQVLREPYQLEMSAWFVTNEKLDAKAKAKPAYKGKPIPNCGTAACIAGWAITFGTKHRKPLKAAIEFSKKQGSKFEGLRHNGNSEDKSTARELLELTEDEAQRLFFIDNWPEQFINENKFIEKYQEWHTFLSHSKEKQAELTAKRIEHFIKTNGEE